MHSSSSKEAAVLLLRCSTPASQIITIFMPQNLAGLTVRLCRALVQQMKSGPWSNNLSRNKVVLHGHRNSHRAMPIRPR
jgi:hypothetical protein